MSVSFESTTTTGNSDAGPVFVAGQFQRLHGTIFKLQKVIIPRHADETSDNFLIRGHHELRMLMRAASRTTRAVYGWEQTADQLHVFVEYFDIYLSAMIEHVGALTKLKPAQSYNWQLQQAIDFMGRQCVVLRDLSPYKIGVRLHSPPNNVEYTARDRLLLCDFSHAVHVNDAGSVIGYSVPLEALDPRYTDPLLLTAGGLPSIKSDAYSTGIIGIEMVAGCYPFKKANGTVNRKKLARVAAVDESAFRLETDTTGSKAELGNEWVRLEQGLIAPEPCNRLTPQTARGTSFFYIVASETNKKGPKYIVENPFNWMTLDTCRINANAIDTKEFEQLPVWLSADKNVGGTVFVTMFPLPSVLCGRRSEKALGCGTVFHRETSIVQAIHPCVHWGNLRLAAAKPPPRHMDLFKAFTGWNYANNYRQNVQLFLKKPQQCPKCGTLGEAEPMWCTTSRRFMLRCRKKLTGGKYCDKWFPFGDYGNGIAAVDFYLLPAGAPQHEWRSPLEPNRTGEEKAVVSCEPQEVTSIRNRFPKLPADIPTPEHVRKHSKKPPLLGDFADIVLKIAMLLACFGTALASPSNTDNCDLMCQGLADYMTNYHKLPDFLEYEHARHLLCHMPTLKHQCEQETACNCTSWARTMTRGSSTTTNVSPFTTPNEATSSASLASNAPASPSSRDTSNLMSTQGAAEFGSILVDRLPTLFAAWWPVYAALIAGVAYLLHRWYYLSKLPKGPNGKRIRQLDVFTDPWYIKYLPGMKGMNERFEGAGLAVSQLMTLHDGLKQLEQVLPDDAEACTKAATKETMEQIKNLTLDIMTSGKVPTFLRNKKMKDVLKHFEDQLSLEKYKETLQNADKNIADQLLSDAQKAAKKAASETNQLLGPGSQYAPDGCAVQRSDTVDNDVRRRTPESKRQADDPVTDGTQTTPKTTKPKR